MKARGHAGPAVLFSAPALTLLGIFWIWPMLEAGRISLYDYNIFTGEGTWQGLTNYLEVLGDNQFLKALVTTSVFALLYVPARTALALVLALVLSSGGRGTGTTRTIVLIPTVTSLVVISILWALMYSPTNGLFNGLLASLGLPTQPFLTSPDQALVAIVLMMVWKDVGFVMIFYLAGLTTIPSQLTEAARVDGADWWHTFRHVTFPLLRRTHVFVLTVSTIHAFKIFTPIYLMTDGGPMGSTNVSVLYIFDTAFSFGQPSLAAAQSVLLAAILVVASVLQLRLNSSR